MFTPDSTPDFEYICWLAAGIKLTLVSPFFNSNDFSSEAARLFSDKTILWLPSPFSTGEARKSAIADDGCFKSFSASTIC